MSIMDVVFGEDIVLDEAAFHKAVSELAALAEQLQQLRAGIEDMLNKLKVGFDTPAGAKFVNACERNLVQPLEAQKLVLNHMHQSLSESKRAYEKVFREYEQLQAAINRIDS